MSNLNYLSEGLVIRRYDTVYEFSRQIGSTIHFETEEGEVLPLTVRQFYSEWHEGIISAIPGMASYKEFLVNEDDIAANDAVFDISSLENEKAKSNSLRKYEYITQIQKKGITKGQIELIEEAIPEVAEKIEDSFPPRPQTVARWMREYAKTNGDIICLLDKRLTTPARSPRDPIQDKFIDEILDDFFLCSNPQSFESLYELYQDKNEQYNAERALKKEEPTQILSERTFYRRISDLNKFDVVAAQKGIAYAKKQFSISKGHLISERPLEFVEIDHTLLDLYVIDDKYFIPLGRPWLTLVRDRFSGTIIGIHVTYEHPSVDSIFCAIKHSIMPHYKAHEEWTDIENEMPFGIAECYVLDRGSDFTAQRTRLGILQLGSDYDYCPVRTPELKATIERTFKTFNELLETLPGRTYPHLHERDGYDSSKHAVVRFSSFVWILYKWACDSYNLRENKLRNAPRIELWNEGIILHEPPIPPSKDTIDSILGQQNISKLRHDGIRFQYLFYGNSSRLEEIFREYGSIDILYKINRTDLGWIMVQDPRDKTFFKVPCLYTEYAEGLSLVQHKLIRKQAKEKYKDNEKITTLIKTKLEIMERIREDATLRDNAIKKKYARFSGINSEDVFQGNESNLEKAILLPNQINSEEIYIPTSEHLVLEEEKQPMSIPTFDYQII